LYIYLGKSSILDVFKKQIVSFVIAFDETDRYCIKRQTTNIFKNILIMFTNLQYLNYKPSPLACQYISLDVRPQTFISCPSLLELYINLKYFRDCLYLLNSNFNNLSKLYLNILTINSIETMDIKVTWFMFKQINQFFLAKIN
jgi:hypothetical protein